MKRIIATLTALALGVGAFAKGLEELAGEFSKLTELNDKIIFLNTNKEDCAKAYKDWDFSKRTKEEVGLFASLYYNTDALDDISDAEGIRLNVDAWAKKTLAKNPQAFELCAARDYVVGDNIKLNVRQIILFGRIANAYDALYRLDPYEIAHCGDNRAILSYFEAVKKVALRSSDNEAYGKTLELENAFSELPNGNFKTELLGMVQSLQDTVFLRVSRANKLK